MISPILESDWSPVCDPIRICSLPLHVSDVGDRLQITFDSAVEDGMGTVLFSFVSIDKHLALLKSYVDDPDEAQYVSVWVLGQETQWDSVISSLCEELCVDSSDLPFVESELVPGELEIVTFGR